MTEPVEAARAKAESLLLMGRHAEAVDVARQGLAQAPDDLHLLDSLASALSDGHQLDEAQRVAERLVALAPDSPRGHLLRGWILHRRGRSNEATTALEQAVRLDPSSSQSRVMLVEALVRRAGQGSRLSMRKAQRDRLLAEAQSHAEEALRLSPTSEVPHLVRAKVALAHDRLPEARTWVERGLAIEPSNHVGHQLLGLIAERVGDLRAAGDHYVAAGQLNPHSTTSLERLRKMRGAVPLGGLALYVLIRLLTGLGRAAGGAWVVIVLVLAVLALALNWWWLPRRRVAKALSERARTVLQTDKQVRRRH